MSELKGTLLRQLTAAREQFRRSTSPLGDDVAAFRPAEEMMTAAQHVAHAAQVIDWLVAGARSEKGFDLDFEPQIERVMATRSLQMARDWFERAMTGAIEFVQGTEEAKLLSSLPEGPVLGGMPRYSIVLGIAEHTSHHRGALTVYARLSGISPGDPYGI